MALSLKDAIREARHQPGGGDRRIPPMIRCPLCQPAAVSYAGHVLNIVCRTCRDQIAEAAK